VKNEGAVLFWVNNSPVDHKAGYKSGCGQKQMKGEYGIIKCGTLGAMKKDVNSSTFPTNFPKFMENSCKLSSMSSSLLQKLKLDFK